MSVPYVSWADGVPPYRELREDGEQQGRDPRTLSPDDLTAVGLERQSRGDAIRAKCLDCVGQSPAEVRRCSAVDCSLWPFRMGTDPWREPRVMTDEQRRAGAERLANARVAKRGGKEARQTG